MTRLARLLTAFALALAIATAPARAASPILKEIEEAFITLHEQVGPAVVNIDTKGPGDEAGMEDLFRFFGMPGPGPGDPRAEAPRMQATGTGFIIDKEGHIITNNHVVEKADQITIRMFNGKEYQAKVIGRDPDTDLAVIKITPDGDLPVAVLGDSDSVKVGQFAVAIGSPRQLEGSVSFGHISALGREGLQGLRAQGLRFQNLIQTDAAINLGNSGGPLCNIDGQVIGINTAIVWGANSIGFAIPVNVAKTVVPQLIEKGKVTRGFLGVGIDDASRYAAAVNLPDNNGAFVKEIRENTPAARADIRTYDVIRKVNGDVVKSAANLVDRISALPPGAEATLEIWRDGAAIDVLVKLDEWQASADAAPTAKDVLGMEVRALDDDMRRRMKVNPDVNGVVIIKVKPGSAAEEARLEPGNIINEIGREPVDSVSTFHALMEKHGAPGKSVLIGYTRPDGQSDITVLRVPSE